MNGGLIRVNSTVEEKESCYVLRFGLPPYYHGGRERGQLRLSLPKRIVNQSITVYFGRAPLLYPRKLRVINGDGVYVEKGASFPRPIHGVWQAFVEDSPWRFDNDI